MKMREGYGAIDGVGGGGDSEQDIMGRAGVNKQMINTTAHCPYCFDSSSANGAAQDLVQQLGRLEEQGDFCAMARRHSSLSESSRGAGQRLWGGEQSGERSAAENGAQPSRAAPSPPPPTPSP